ncbi:MAG: chemotaxis protein CheA [Terriglobales bacterium]
MTFFSDERASELRDLFFESAQELLQALNEEGLELEKRPGDAEIVRTIRRTVHTLKGDSAACGFKELSELAHELEDALTPAIVQRSDDAAAQLVLSAADMFDSMLSAYRGNMQPPDGASLREMIRQLAQNQTAHVSAVFEPQFAWSEYERLIIQQGANGNQVFNVAVAIDAQCPMRAAALQLVRNVLQESGAVLVIHPEDGSPGPVDVVEAAIASQQEPGWIMRKCRIPSVVANVVVVPLEVTGVAVPNATAPPVLTVPDPPAPKPPEAVKNGTQPPVTGEEQPSSAPSHVPLAAENILRVDAERIDAVLNLVGELIIGKSMLHQTVSEFSTRFPKDPLRNKFVDMMAHQAQVLNDLQRSVMKIRMVPVEQLFRRFPRVVRDVAKQQGKEVELVLSGQETDLDKSILDALAEPLTHLVRNAVDHGIESPLDRVAAGKPATGTVRLDAYHQGNHVVIEVSDDGRGIDRQRVAQKAVELGTVKSEQLAHLTDAELLGLIFEPGFSTAEEITQVSGRGVGLDVVKSVLERMKGTVTVQSRPGEGTKFLLKVPLTLAIIKALLFLVDGRMYAVPLASVLEIARTSEAEIHRVDFHEVIQLRDQVLTIVRLSRLNGHNGSRKKSRRSFVIVISVADRKFGLMVEQLIGEEELVIKAIDDQLVSTEMISGASILGDGKVVLILNLAAVVEKLGRIRSAPARPLQEGGAREKFLGANA